jgi:cyanophycinase-like exopeptidase
MKASEQFQPGPIVLFGSGETSPSGRKIFEQVFRHLRHAPNVALLETPAGFELNSDRVIGRVGDFLRHRLQNYDPQIFVVPARRRGTPNSPDNAEILTPLLTADLIFMGPGSPSYAVRQLRDTLAWNILCARHRMGAALVMASAAAIAMSAYALPVYEIYKVGEDPHWKQGLDFFGAFGLPLIFIPHWNNNDGGDELDTSRCFMGQTRFSELMQLLPSDLTVLGIDEKTALILDIYHGTARVIGLGGVTLIHTGHRHPRELSPDLNGTGLDEVAQARNGHVHQYRNGQVFPLSECCPFELPDLQAGIPEAVWQTALEAQQLQDGPLKLPPQSALPDQVQALVEARQYARAHQDWAAADALRRRIGELGWQVIDTPDGPQLREGANHAN